MKDFDERRLIDSRFWLFMGALSHFFFQLGQSMNPVTEEQVYVNYVYWAFWVSIVFCLIYSFKNIQAIIPGLLLYTVRGIIIMYDFEKRQDKIPQVTWHMTVVYQIMVFCCNMILLNNVMDRGLLFVGIVLSGAVYFGIINSFFKENGVVIKGAHQNFSVIFTLSILIVGLVMYMQKRMHKEVFMEIKQRVSS